MNKENKLKELELEIARLKGVIEGMKANPYHMYPRTYPAANPYQAPFWYQTYCGGNTSQFLGTTTQSSNITGAN